MPVLKYKDPADGQWKPVPLASVLDLIRRSGDRMTGPLALPNAVDPDHAVPLGQADARYVNVGGDTMSARLTISSANASDLLAVDNLADGAGEVVYGVRKGNDGLARGSVVRMLPTFDYAPMKVGTPSEQEDAATKRYVDGRFAPPSETVRIFCGIENLVFSGGGADLGQHLTARGITTTVQGFSCQAWGGQSAASFNVEIGAPATFRIFGKSAGNVPLEGTIPIVFMGLGW